jgi:hypothetical protein
MRKHQYTNGTLQAAMRADRELLGNYVASGIYRRLEALALENRGD